MLVRLPLLTTLAAAWNILPGYPWNDYPLAIPSPINWWSLLPPCPRSVIQRLFNADQLDDAEANYRRALLLSSPINSAHYFASPTEVWRPTPPVRDTINYDQPASMRDPLPWDHYESPFLRRRVPLSQSTNRSDTSEDQRNDSQVQRQVQSSGEDSDDMKKDVTAKAMERIRNPPKGEAPSEKQQMVHNAQDMLKSPVKDNQVTKTLTDPYYGPIASVAHALHGDTDKVQEGIPSKLADAASSLHELPVWNSIPYDQLPDDGQLGTIKTLLQAGDGDPVRGAGGGALLLVQRIGERTGQFTTTTTPAPDPYSIKARIREEFGQFMPNTL